MAKCEPKRFIATIYKIWMMRYVDVPEKISSALAKQMSGDAVRKRPRPKYIPVVTIVNRSSARTALVPAQAGRYRVAIDTLQRKAGLADVGDLVSVELHLDRSSRSLAVPQDLRSGLRRHPKAWKAFVALAPGRRQFIRWFDSAKAPETRRKRLARAVDVLLERALLSVRRRI